MFGNGSAFPAAAKKPMGAKAPMKPAASPMTPTSTSGSTGLAAKIAECEQKIADLEQRVSALEGGEQGENEQGEADSTPGGDYSAY